jgi:hypothetical protein
VVNPPDHDDDDEDGDAFSESDFDDILDGDDEEVMAAAAAAVAHDVKSRKLKGSYKVRKEFDALIPLRMALPTRQNIKEKEPLDV